MTTRETPGDVRFMDAQAPRHIVLDEARQRQRVMIVGDIHGECNAELKFASMKNWICIVRYL